MENQLAKLTITEIKALVYDELAKAEVAQNNIRILNQELRNRAQGAQQPTDGQVVNAADFTSPVN